MGYCWHLLNPRTNEWFDLGKGDYAGPLEEFGHWDLDQSIHTTNELHIEFSRNSISRKDLGNSRKEFILIYCLWFATDEESSPDDSAYRLELAGKIWDWMDDEIHWLYGDHCWEVLNYKEWKETGTRYTG
jgi:hypothetical protein